MIEQLACKILFSNPEAFLAQLLGRFSLIGWLALFAPATITMGGDTENSKESSQTEEALLEISPELLDLGSLVIGKQGALEGTLRVKNNSDSRARLIGLRVACGCVKARPSFDHLKPGETGSLAVTVSPKRGEKGTKRIRVVMQGKSRYSADARIRWDCKHLVNFEVARSEDIEDGDEEVSFVRDTLYFGTLRPGETRTATLRFSYDGTDDERASTRISISAARSTRPNLRILEPSDKNKFQVEFTAPDHANMHPPAQLAIEFDVDGRPIPSRVIPVRFSRSLPDLVIVPETLTFWKRPNGEFHRKPIKMLSRQGHPTSVKSARWFGTDNQSMPVRIVRAEGFQDTKWSRYELEIPIAEGWGQRVEMHFEDETIEPAVIRVNQRLLIPSDE